MTGTVFNKRVGHPPRNERRRDFRGKPRDGLSPGHGPVWELEPMSCVFSDRDFRTHAIVRLYFRRLPSRFKGF